MLRRSLRVAAPTLLPELCRGNRRVSRLDNGMRIMSYEDNTAVAGLALYSRMGARFETQRNAGATSVIESAVLLGNKFQSEAELCRDLFALGSSFRTSSDVREIFGWCINVPRFSVADGLAILQHSALHPRWDAEMVDAAKQLAMQKSVFAERDSTRVCFEMLHQAAFGEVALGRPLWHEPEAIEKLSIDSIRDFHSAFVQPERTTLVASGIEDHDELVGQVEATFKFPEKPSRVPEPGKDIGYVGGTQLRQNDKAPDSVTKFQEKNLTHIGLCFKGIPLNHPDYFAYTVIQTLMGGGTSFSSGGPGKGMHTKLFREAIMTQGWLHGVECVSAWYENAGLLGLYGQSEHQFAKPLLNLMMFQAATIPARISDKDVEMAKNQLMSQLVLLAEARDIALDESSKLLLQFDSVILPEDLMRGAEQMKLADIQRVVADMIKTVPTVAIFGNTEGMPGAEDISKIVQQLHAKHC